MIYSSIRSRILTTALLPVVLVVIGLVGFFASSRLGDMHEAHQRWSKLLVNQLAQALGMVSISWSKSFSLRLSA